MKYEFVIRDRNLFQTDYLCILDKNLNEIALFIILIKLL
jgi:hypothetical protein